NNPAAFSYDKTSFIVAVNNGKGSNNPNANVVITADTAPSSPTAPAQFKSNGTTSLAIGATTNESTVVLKGTVADTDAGDFVRLQVEVKPVGTLFANAATATSSAVSSGTTASVAVTGLADSGYHWQAR